MKSLLGILLLLSHFGGTVHAQCDEEGDWTEDLKIVFKQKPAMSTYYGYARSSLRGTGEGLASQPLLTMKIGGILRKDEDEGILSYRYNYLSIATISTEFLRSRGQGIAGDYWRLGFAWERGLGYEIGSEEFRPALIPYHTTGVNWSRFHPVSSSIGMVDRDLVTPFESAVRFGTNMEAGIKFHATPLLAFDAAVERTIVFRRHLFWKWAGSALLVGAGHWAADRFVERVLDSTPMAAPVVNFILKNGLSFAFYQLAKEKMNYPFPSEAPLMNDAFKIGVTFVL